MPWSIKEEMAHFTRLTKGWPCIMGRKTWESLKKKPLPGRLNVVISGKLTEARQLCPQTAALSPNGSSVPKRQLCPQTTALSPEEQPNPNIKISPSLLAVGAALSPSSSSVPKQQLCPQTAALSPEEQPCPIKISPSLPAAIEHCAAYEKIFICGGESIYKQALTLADKIELSVIHKQYDGDTFFPEIDDACWTITSTEDFDDFSFITYTRIKQEQI
jgi:dihydrofolate reductase